MARTALSSGYSLVDGPPTVAAYLELRRRTGLTPRREDQAKAALRGDWASVHVVDDAGADAVGMGRVIADGGWYFHIVDMAVLPDHQRRGIGAAMLEALLERIRRDAPPGPYVSLLADLPGRELYSRFGFRPTAPGTVGMALPEG